MGAKDINNVVIIGAGLMGSGIGLIFASKGYNVTLYDKQESALDKAIDSIRDNLNLMAKNGIGSLEETEKAIKNITTTNDINKAVSNAEIVIESVYENMELKQNIFYELDSLCPKDTILASNTSVMSITEIAQKCKLKERILGTHFWNPPFLIPLVEVVKTEDTSEEVMDITMELLKLVGKRPVRVNKDVPGFLANRLQHALWREAISIVENGIADAKTVDESIKYGFGLRLPILGPLENVDMVGTDLTLAIHDYIFKDLDNSTEASPILKEKVNNGELGFKTGSGFQKWSNEDIEKSKTRLLEYLLEVNKKLLK